MKNLIISTKKNLPIVSLMSAAVFGFLGLALVPAAVFAFTTPTLSLSNLNNGTVQVNISGDSDATIYLYYYNASSPVSIGTIGNTGQNGYFSEALSPYPNNNGSLYAYTGASYNAALAAIPYGAPVYAVVDGLQSSSVSWPLSYGTIVPVGQTVGTPALGTFYFNPTSINLTVGQSQNVQIYQNAYQSGVYNYANSYYISSNTNSAAVSASLTNTAGMATVNGTGGPVLSVTALAPGVATITVCQNSLSYPNEATGQCTALYITVSYANAGYNYYQNYPITNNYPINYGYPTTNYPAPYVNTNPVTSYIPATVYNAYPTYSPPTYYPSTYYPTYYPY